jgi:hypothetical protein
MALKRGLAAVFGLLAIAILISAWHPLRDWVSVRFTDGYYVEFDYLRQGLWLGIPGALALVVSLYVLIRRNAHGSWLAIPMVLLLMLAIAIPGFVRFPASEAGHDVHRRAQSVAGALVGWSGASGRFPATEAEFQEAMKRVDREEAARPSRYARAGQRIPLRFVFVPGAKGPHQPTPPGDQPAILYCAVSEDGRRLWLTATGLDQNVGGAVVLLEFEPGLRWLEVKTSGTTDAHR